MQSASSPQKKGPEDIRTHGVSESGGCLNAEASKNTLADGKD